MKHSDSIFVGILLKEDNGFFNKNNFFENFFHFKKLLENDNKKSLTEDEFYIELSPEMKELLLFCRENNEIFEFEEVLADESYVSIKFKTEKPIVFNNVDTFTWNDQNMANIMSEVLKCKDVCEYNMSQSLFEMIQPVLGVNFIKLD